MYADRHFAQKRANPYSLSASALIVGGALAAALLIKGTQYIRHEPPTMDPVDVVEVLPPPPMVEKIKPKDTKLKLTPIPQNPDPVIKTPVESKVVVNAPEFVAQPTDFGVDDGSGGVTVDPPAPLPPPLFIEPALDPRAELQPPYPSSEVRAGREGSVAVRVLIGIDGRVKDVQKIRATSDAFFEATRRQALGRWRFKPATRGGIPEEAWKTLSLRFVLENR